MVCVCVCLMVNVKRQNRDKEKNLDRACFNLYSHRYIWSLLEPYGP